ncbi:MAG: tRNA (adenosine(37)-N6)-dimethylallyltransferase MiaA [Lachnospiraceae bacterium]|nr:tRNA (adenosine(37)-N6)-dimethylallyltransferase MiaA [Lachnospiraceae bacterium]
MIIAGPTACGKSAAAVECALKLNGEVISADSMQVYRGMDIGTAKITAEEMKGVPHHLLDVLDPSEDFNIKLFKDLCLEAMEGIYSRGHLPIICGGTGFYIQSVLRNVDLEEAPDTGIRKELEAEDPEKLFEMLKEIDPASAEAIHPNNVKRVIRAIEFYRETGRPISEHNAEQRQNEYAYNAGYYVLCDDRAVMYERIDRRVDKMAENGLVEEVKALKAAGMKRGSVAMQGLGYKEIFAYLDGEISLDEALYTIKRDSRHFAKRQLTWFKREGEAVTWVDRTAFTDPEREIPAFICRDFENRIMTKA